MKILVTRSTYSETDPHFSGQDYLSDCVLHGLRQLFGDSVVDSPRLWYMYKSEFYPNTNVIPQHVLYGRGFTIFNTLETDTIDRTDIEQKIKTRYFDLIIFSRIDFGSPYADLIMKHYSPSEIIFLDGQDTPILYNNLIGKGIYFKRELAFPVNGILPISFGFPREKIQKSKEKLKMMCSIDPRDRSTYTHWIESAYYDDYNQSLFGVTTCKGGWDCMRHYEILGSRCIPLFLDLAHCPNLTCTTLPKSILLDVLHKVKNYKYFDYQEVENTIHQHFVNNCLTDHLAKYIVDQYTKAN